MKRKITLSIALALSLVLISLTASDSIVKAQPQQPRAAFDSGMVTLGANQTLRVSVVGDWNGDNDVNVRFRKTEYAPEGACGSGGVCKYSIASQSTSAPLTLMPGEAAYYDQSLPMWLRIRVLSSSRNVRVTAAIIDTVTGATVTQIIMANTEGDF